MPELKLRTENVPEESLDGWFLADGHWLAGDCGVLLVVSPAMRDKIKSGLSADELGRALARTEHCMNVILQRQLNAVRAKAKVQ